MSLPSNKLTKKFQPIITRNKVLTGDVIDCMTHLEGKGVIIGKRICITFYTYRPLKQKSQSKNIRKKISQIISCKIFLKDRFTIVFDDNS